MTPINFQLSGVNVMKKTKISEEDKHLIEELLQSMPPEEVAEKFDVNRRYIVNYAKNYGIESPFIKRKGDKSIARIRNKAEVLTSVKNAIAGGMTTTEACELVGISINQYQKLNALGLKKFDLKDVKEQYQKGYKAALTGLELTDNPNPSHLIKVFCAWAAGWNDCDMGYSLDMSVFN